MTTGYIYILSNPSFMGEIYKVGVTRRTPEGRADKLGSHTGVPSSFILEYAEYVPEADKAERIIHAELEAYRVNLRREFFCCGLNNIINIIRSVADQLRRGQYEIEKKDIVEILDCESCCLPVVEVERNDLAIVPAREKGDILDAEVENKDIAIVPVREQSDISDVKVEKKDIAVIAGREPSYVSPVETASLGICNYRGCYSKAYEVVGAGVKYCYKHIKQWDERKR